MKLEFKMKYSKPKQELKFKPEDKCFEYLSQDLLEKIFKEGSIELNFDGLTSMELTSFELKSMDTFGPLSILKNIAVFLSASLFRIMAVVILSVSFCEYAIIIMLVYILLLYLFLGITACCNLRGEKD